MLETPAQEAMAAFSSRLHASLEQQTVAAKEFSKAQKDRKNEEKRQKKAAEKRQFLVCVVYCIA